MALILSSLLVSNKCFPDLVGVAFPVAGDVVGHGVSRVQLHVLSRKVGQRAEHVLEVRNISQSANVGIGLEGLLGVVSLALQSVGRIVKEIVVPLRTNERSLKCLCCCRHHVLCCCTKDLYNIC